MNESWYNAEAAAGVARVNPILAVLADGAKTYRELFGIVANLDETLKGLRDRREISLVTSWDGVNRFALPSPPAREPEDVPKRPVLHLPKKPKPEPYGDLRVCKTCGVEKRTSQFGWVRNRFSRKSTCTKCYYEKSKRGSGMAGSHAKLTVGGELDDRLDRCDVQDVGSCEAKDQWHSTATAEVNHGSHLR